MKNLFTLKYMIFLLALLFSIHIIICQFDVGFVDETLYEMFATAEKGEYVSDVVYEKFGYKKASLMGGTTTNVVLKRLFSIHFFGKGYVWYKYTCAMKAVNGTTTRHSWNIPYRVQIEKIDGKWHIVDSREHA